MGDEIDAMQAAIDHGPVVGLGAGVALVAAKLFGPSLDEVGRQLQEVVKGRLEVLRKTGEKQEIIAQAHEKDLDGTRAHVRVVQRVLNDATLYDDDLQHTYVAGMVAGSRNDDGSDDRPIYYLSVIDRLTSLQVSLFHTLYSAAAQIAPHGGVREGADFRLLRIDVAELGSQLAKVSDAWASDTSDITASILALEHGGLINQTSVRDVESGDACVRFCPTRIGALLFDWAHGFSDDSVHAFAHRQRPSIGLPELDFRTVQIVS